jgi:hypothetical protein
VTTTVAAVTRERISQLILAPDGSKLSKDEVDAIDRFVAASTSLYVGRVDEEILCVWGLIPPTLLSDQAYLWLQITPAAAEHQFILVRRGQIEMKKMLEVYPKIVGHCEAGAAQSIRWLGWLGAEFGPPEGDLVPFIIQRKEA